MSTHVLCIIGFIKQVQEKDKLQVFDEYLIVIAKSLIISIISEHECKIFLSCDFTPLVNGMLIKMSRHISL